MTATRNENTGRATRHLPIKQGLLFFFNNYYLGWESHNYDKYHFIYITLSCLSSITYIYGNNFVSTSIAFFANIYLKRVNSLLQPTRSNPSKAL